MTKRSALFFDIDGTLIAEDASRYLPDSAKEAIAKARSAGHLAFINTGRVFINVDDFIRDVGFDGYVCGCGTFIQYQNEVLLHNQLSKELCHDMAALAYDCGVFGLFEAADANGVDARIEVAGDARELIKYFKSMGKRFMTDVTAPDFYFDKFTGWFGDNADIKRFRREVEKEFTYIDRGKYFCEIVPRGFSKATGIQFLLEYFGIDWENSYAFGDSANDLPMLEYVKNSIVMGESDDTIKNKASFVTKSVREDGLFYAMKHFGLLG